MQFLIFFLNLADRLSVPNKLAILVGTSLRDINHLNQAASSFDSGKVAFCVAVILKE